jgi:hypothetical protein
MDEDYYYCLHDETPHSNSKGAYVYRYHSGVIFSSNIKSRVVVSPIFDSYHALKSWFSENNYYPAPQYTLSNGDLSSHCYFRLRKTFKKYDPLSLKKTRKLILPPKIVEVENNADKINLKNDEYIQIVCGEIKPV